MHHRKRDVDIMNTAFRLPAADRGKPHIVWQRSQGGHGLCEDIITPHLKVGAKALLPELLLTALLLTFGTLVNFFPVRSISFIEGDTALSHPLQPETVPAGRLLELALAWPAVLLAVLTMAIRGLNKPAMRTLGWLELGLLQAFGLALAAGCVLKIATARHRPNFFSSCNYHGFRDAQSEGSLSSYNARITPGALGNLDNCWARLGGEEEPLLMRQAMQGFPSSHTGLCFAGCGFLAAAARALFKLRGGQWFSWHSMLACSPLVAASYVGVTRIRDRYHTEGDVATGASLGLLCASLAWSQFTAFPGRNELALSLAALPEPALPGARDWVGEDVPADDGAEAENEKVTVMPDMMSGPAVQVAADAYGPLYTGTGTTTSHRARKGSQRRRRSVSPTLYS